MAVRWEVVRVAYLQLTSGLSIVPKDPHKSCWHSRGVCQSEHRAAHFLLDDLSHKPPPGGGRRGQQRLQPEINSDLSLPIIGIN